MVTDEYFKCNQSISSKCRSTTQILRLEFHFKFDDVHIKHVCRLFRVLLSSSFLFDLVFLLHPLFVKESRPGSKVRAAPSLSLCEWCAVHVWCDRLSFIFTFTSKFPLLWIVTRYHCLNQEWWNNDVASDLFQRVNGLAEADNGVQRFGQRFSWCKWWSSRKMKWLRSTQRFGVLQTSFSWLHPESSGQTVNHNSTV